VYPLNIESLLILSIKSFELVFFFFISKFKTSYDFVNADFGKITRRNRSKSYRSGENTLEGLSIG